MSNAPVTCLHCGTPVPASREDAFCCAGCAYVHELLHREGLNHFYDLRGGKTLPPVPVQALRDRDDAWLKSMAETATESVEEGGVATLSLAVQGLSCVGCVWLMERVFSRHEGGVRLDVDVVRGELRVAWRKGAFDVTEFAAELQGFGYLVGPPRRESEMEASAIRGLERRMGVCGAFAMNAMAFSLPRYFGMPSDFAFAGLFELVTVVSATLALLVGGSYFAERSWRGLRAGVLHIDTPIALGLLVAYGGSLAGWLGDVAELKYFDFVGTFTFLMLAGRWAQQASVERNRRRLMRDTSIPESVLVEGPDRVWNDAPLSALAAGVRFRIKGSQTVPVACRLESDRAAVSLEWINGESEAQSLTIGQMIPSGALNIRSGMIEAEALESWDVSTLNRLLESRRPSESRDVVLERVLRWYLAAVLVVGVAGCAGWWMAGDSMTLENPVLEDETVLFDLNDQARAALRRLVTGNLHPVSRSVFDAVGPGRLMPCRKEAEEVIGQGTRIEDDEGGVWALGRPGWQAEGSGDVVFSKNGGVLAELRFREALRSETVEECGRLTARGVELSVLSGDREAKVRGVAEQLGLGRNQWEAAMTPESKAAWIRAHDGEASLFLGDGANDSLAFDAALCAGSPVTGRSFLEQKADFFFMGHSLRFVTHLMEVALRHRRATRLAFGFAVTYNLAAVTVGLLGGLNPVLAAVLMPLSSVITLALVSVSFSWRRSRSEMPETGVVPTALPEGA